MKKGLITLIFILSVQHLPAQEKLKLEDIISAALKNHWSISVTANRQQAAERSLRLSNLSFLPDITLNASRLSSVNNTNQEFASGLTQQKTGARSGAWSADLIADLTLFDGFRMFEAKKLIEHGKSYADAGAVRVRESIIYNVSLTYYSIVRKKMELRELKRSMGYSEQRIIIANTKFEAGSAAKPELLQTKMDLNTRKSETIRRELELIALKASLNLLMGKSPETMFDVIDTLETGAPPSFDQVIGNVGNSSEIIQKKIRKEEATTLLKISRSELYPRLNATGMYSFDHNTSQAGFLLFNRTTGFSTGFGLNWNIFSGGRNRILINNASVEVMNADLELQEANSRLRSEVFTHYNYFLASSQITTLEKENYLMAEENVMIATERYKLGLSSLLELTDAQRNLDIAVSRLFTALYESKIAELRMKLSAGMLGK